METSPKRHLSLDKAPVEGKTANDDGADCNGVDMISKLPSDIICHILSFLPTKYAAGTAVLSTKWRSLLRLIPNLTVLLDDSSLLHPESSPSTYLISFKNFADQLLNVTLHGVPSVYALVLNCKKFDDGQDIANWIDAALRLEVQEIELRIRRPKNSSFLFESLFGCNISALYLDVDFGRDYPECGFSFPNLASLFARDMKVNALNNLLQGCPVLEFLVIKNCHSIPGEVLRICIPSLDFLVFINDAYSLKGGVQLDAPKLVNFHFYGNLANLNLAKNLKSLCEARLELNQSVIRDLHESTEQAAKLLKACSCAERLWLSAKFVTMLHNVPRALPTYRNLTRLTIMSMESHGWEMLPSLLERASKLEYLVIIAAFDDERYACFKDSLKKPLSISLTERSEVQFVLKIQRELDS